MGAMPKEWQDKSAQRLVELRRAFMDKLNEFGDVQDVGKYWTGGPDDDIAVMAECIYVGEDGEMVAYPLRLSMRYRDGEGRTYNALMWIDTVHPRPGIIPVETSVMADYPPDTVKAGDVIGHVSEGSNQSSPLTRLSMLSGLDLEDFAARVGIRRMVDVTGSKTEGDNELRTRVVRSTPRELIERALAEGDPAPGPNEAAVQDNA